MKSSPYIVAKKIKPKEIMLCTFAMNDEAYDAGFSLDVVCNFINMLSKNLPKESALIAIPQWMTLEPMNKEEFRMLLDKAEELEDRTAAHGKTVSQIENSKVKSMGIYGG